MSMKHTLASLGLVEKDEPPPVHAPAAAAPASVGDTIAWPRAAAPQGNADTDMVAKLKASVLSASPIVTQFMANLDVVRPQFPGDDASALKAALAFTRTDKATLVHELQTTVAASFAHAKQGMESDRKKALEAAVGDQQQMLEATQARRRDLENKLAEAKTSEADLQAKIQAVETDLQKQDSVVQASLADVERFIFALNNTLSKP